MKKIASLLLQFFKGNDGEKSSKRLVFISSALQLNLMVIGLLGCFIYKRQFENALELLTYYGCFVLIAGGFVTMEVFKNFKKK